MELRTKDRKWILLVDDEPEIRSTLSELINVTFGDSAKVVEASNGSEATSKISCQMFDCIVTDLVMPKKEGDAFIASVRNNAFNETTPVIVLSGNPDKKSSIEKFDFVYFTPKPCQFESMSAMLKDQLKIGSTENRVSADALNSIISLTSSFIATYTEDEDVKQTDLVSKKVGEEVESLSMSTVVVKFGKVKNYFSLIVTKSDIEKLKKIRPELSDKDEKTLSESLSFVILNNLIKKAKANFGNRYEVAPVKESKDEVKSKAGIILTLGNEHLQLRIFASTQKN